ncbi:MAG: hypothetical protein HQK54_16485 [Oligoflexales bacterium]|nr:hypothetical protein [Oligoflexales bacterium]
MKKCLVSVLLQMALLVYGSLAFADPIPDGAFAAKSSGWFASAGKACKLLCSEKGASPEYESYKNSGIDDRLSWLSVCKVYLKESTGAKESGWLYGNNLNAPKYSGLCAYPDPDGGATRYSQYFWCLCVKN